MDMKFEKVVFPTILLALLGTSCWMFLSSRWGVGVTHDSIFYLSSAGNLVNHNGLQWSASDGGLHPLTHFPPLYSLVLALIMLLGIPSAKAATWLAGILLGLNVFTSGYFVYRFSRSKILAIMAALALTIATGFVNLHLFALSEPLFVWLILCGIGTLGLYFEKPSGKWLVAAAILAALSVLARYIGIAVIATGFLAIVMLDKTSFRARIKNLLIYLGISLGPLFLWAVRNFILAGSTTNRTLIYHPLDWGNRKLGFETISGWFTSAPVPYKATIAISGLFLGVIFFWWLWLGWKLIFSKNLDSSRADGFRVVFMLNLFSLVYVAGVLFSLTFFDASTRLDGRILAPVYVSFICALFTMLGSLATRWQWVGSAVAIMILVINLPATISSVSDFHDNGKGFASRDWQKSQAVDYVRNVPNESVIYTNQGMALYFLTGRPIHDVPEKMDVVRNIKRADYPTQLKLMVDDLNAPHSFIVWFSEGGLSDSVLNETNSDLQTYKNFPDANIIATSANIRNGSLP
jgi:hypothetical protein